MRRLRLAAPAVFIALLAAASAGGGSDAVAAGGCPATSSLSRPGSAVTRFTMLIRVNQVENARTYGSSDTAAGGLADRIRPQDVFLINTRFPDSGPGDWSKIAGILHRDFPCNRIASLNGLGGDPQAPGYAYALSGDTRIWAMLTDWERLDWGLGRASNPYLGAWSGKFARASKRARRWVGRLIGSAPRAGLVPELRGKWDYGALARNVSAPHRTLAPGRRGLVSVQTQDVCAGAGGRGMKASVGTLLREYKRANFRRIGTASGRRKVRYRRRKWRVHAANMSVQVSFTERPQPASGMALLRTSPDLAAKCTVTALRRGAGAILYWASPDSMRSLLSLPRMCALRPSSTC